MPLYRIGKTWYIDLATARGRIRRSAKTTDRREAQAYFDRVKRESWRQEQLGEAPRVTWGEALGKWMAEKNPGLPDRYRLRRLDIPLAAPLPISSTELVRSTAALAAGSWNRLLSLIVSIHKISGVTPPTLSRRPSPQGRIRWLTAEEWERLRLALSKESPLLEQCARFALATGLRENNVLELEWAQVDLNRRTAFWHADQMKGRATHGIPLTDDALAVLVERRGKHKRFVFAHPDSGKPLVKASNKAWYKALRKAKLVGVRWHDLRHTWASWAVMSGVGLRDLMELGGWKTFSMVQRYSHLSSDHLAESAAKIRPISLQTKRQKTQKRQTGG